MELKELKELEEATKSIFIQCLMEPDVIEKIKSQLKGDDNEANQCNSIENSSTNGEKSNSTTDFSSESIINMLNKVLENQQFIVNYVKNNNENKISELTKKYEKEILELTEKHKSEINDLTSKKCKLETDMNNLEKKLSCCDDIISMWSCVQGLETANKNYLYKLVEGDDLLAFLSLGSDEDKIEQLWLFIRDTVVKGESTKEEIVSLNCYFDFCINMYNSTKKEEEKYLILDVKCGDEFEMEKHIKTPGSRQIGTIKEVLVKSYTYKEQIKYKAIVCVE